MNTFWWRWNTLLCFIVYPLFLYGNPDRHVYFSSELYFLKADKDGNFGCIVEIVNDFDEEITSCTLKPSCGCVKVSPAGCFSLKTGTNQLHVFVKLNQIDTVNKHYSLYLDIPKSKTTIITKLVVSGSQIIGWQYSYPKTLFIGKNISFSDFLPYKIEVNYYNKDIADYVFTPIFDETELSLHFETIKYNNFAKIVLWVSPTIMWTNGKNKAKFYIKADNHYGISDDSDIMQVIGEISCIFNVEQVRFDRLNSILLPLSSENIISVFSFDDSLNHFSVQPLSDNLSEIKGQHPINPHSIIIKYLYNSQSKYICLKTNPYCFINVFKHIGNNVYEINSMFKFIDCYSLDNNSLMVQYISPQTVLIKGDGVFNLVLEKDKKRINKQYHFVDGIFSSIK